MLYKKDNRQILVDGFLLFIKSPYILHKFPFLRSNSDYIVTGSLRVSESGASSSKSDHREFRDGKYHLCSDYWRYTVLLSENEIVNRIKYFIAEDL